MAAKYYLTLTNYGSTLIAQAHEQSLIQLQNFVIGDANNVPYDPITEIDRTTLVNQKASVPIQDIQIIDDFIRVTATFGTSVGGFNIHEIGITNETGQLVYIGNYHGGYKPILEDGAGGQLTILIDIKGTSANNISLIVDENINTATQAWVKENYIERSNIVDNLTTEDANKPVSAKQAKDLNDNKLDKTENAVSATKLRATRTISFSGGATGSFNFDGSGNSSAVLTLANSGVVANTYGSNLKIPVITVNAKGLITGVSEQQIPIVDDLTTDEATKPVSARQAKVLKDLFDDLDFALLKGETGRQKLPSGLFFQWFTLNLTPSGPLYANIATLPFAFTESLYAVMAMPMTLHNGDVLTGTGPIPVVGTDTYTKKSFRYRIDTNVSVGLSGNHKIKFYCVGV